VNVECCASVLRLAVQYCTTEQIQGCTNQNPPPKERTDLYSQLRVAGDIKGRKTANRQPPRFLGNFLDFRVSPPRFLRRPADRQGRKALVSRNQSQHPSVSFKNH